MKIGAVAGNATAPTSTLTRSQSGDIPSEGLIISSSFGKVSHNALQTEQDDNA